MVVAGDGVVLCAIVVCGLGLCDCEKLASHVKTGVMLAVINCEKDAVAVGDIVSDNDDDVAVAT